LAKDGFVQGLKRQWGAPRVAPIELAQARSLISGALQLIQKHPKFESSCTPLKAALKAIDALQ
jgi:hypothetical protein